MRRITKLFVAVIVLCLAASCGEKTRKSTNVADGIVVEQTQMHPGEPTDPATDATVIGDEPPTTTPKHESVDFEVPDTVVERTADVAEEAVVSMDMMRMTAPAKAPAPASTAAASEGDMSLETQKRIPPNEPGTITAAEWNDPEHWDFWRGVIASDNYRQMPSLWGFYNNNRVSVEVRRRDGTPVANAPVTIERSAKQATTSGGVTNRVVARGRTNNLGRAELWIDLLEDNRTVDYTVLTLKVFGMYIPGAITPYRDGVNEVTMPAGRENHTIEVAFMVDATGSMGDELEYLKTELVDVIGNVQSSNPASQVRTASVFYRDHQDEYLTRVSDFTTDVNVTADFIAAQRAEGGGDFPEAVDVALEKSLSELQWTDTARTKLLFMLLDAPPHNEPEAMKILRSSVVKAQEQGIRLIPIVASGIDKDTEFLMRFIAMSTGGTYVFITDDSGVGSPHLEPTVGRHEIELLNDLIIKIINRYSK